MLVSRRHTVRRIDGWICGNPGDTRSRAVYSRGLGVEATYVTVASALREFESSGATVIDVCCGVGSLLPYVKNGFSRYIGVDFVRYEGFPLDSEFMEADLNKGIIPLPEGSAEAVVSMEAIEHLENPRALIREMVRLTKPGGLVAVSTPNQLSILSKVCLVVCNQHAYFRDLPSQYPAHITALLEIDLLRIAHECRLTESRIYYCKNSRIPGTRFHWPRRYRARAFNDNIVLVARKPSSGLN